MRTVDNITTKTSMDVEAPPVVNGLHAMVAEVLSNLYGSVEEAVIREYVANGLDATNAAGSAAHVELTLPDPLEQNLVIQDFGSGMSPHEASVRWAAYGNSTKVDDPDFIGNIGAGAKSGFAVSTMILLETTKDGVTTSFNYTWFEGTGPQKVGETVEETQKPNGTTITIPVDPSRAWEQAAKRALLYFGSRVKIDGEVLTDPRGDNPPIIHRMSHVHDEIRLMDGSRIVMAGANFRVPEVVLNAAEEVCIPVHGYMGHVVIEVPNKSLEHTPSREDIKDTPSNVQRIKTALIQQFASPFNEQYLGTTAWETYRNIRKADEWGYSVGYITPEVKDHLDAVDQYLDDVDESRGTVGITYTEGTRQTWSGKLHQEGRNRFSRSRRTVTDGLASGNIGTQAMVFVHSADGTAQRSSKVRQWILDQKPLNYMLIVVTDDKQFEQIEAAGFACMTDAALRKYKPMNHIPSAKSTSVRYDVYNLYEGRSSSYQNKYGVDRIAAENDAMVILDYGRRLPTTNYMTWEQNVELLKEAFGDQRIAVIELSAQASRELAVERIGLPEVDVSKVVEEFNTSATSPLPDKYKRLLTMLSDLSRWGFHARSPESLKALVAKEHDPDSRYRESLMAPIGDFLKTTDDVVALTGLEEPAIVTELRTAYEELTDTDWIDEVVELLAAVEHSLTVDQRLSMAIDEAMSNSGESVLSLEARRLANNYRHYNSHANLELISGLVVAEAYDQLMSDDSDEAEHTA